MLPKYYHTCKLLGHDEDDYRKLHFAFRICVEQDNEEDHIREKEEKYYCQHTKA